MPLADGIIVFVFVDVRQATFHLVHLAGHALILEIAPAARRVGQAVQAVLVLTAGAVLVRLQVLKGENFWTLAGLVVRDLHFAGRGVVGSYVATRLKVQEVTSGKEGHFVSVGPGWWDAHVGGIRAERGYHLLKSFKECTTHVSTICHH